MTNYLTLYLRLALAASYLGSVTSRFGLWGKEVGWGNYDRFLAYTAKVNPFLPSPLIPVIGRIVDVAEIALPALLIVGFRVRETAILSGVMLFLFAFGMDLGFGLIETLNYSVYTASAASFLLAVQNNSFLSLDAYISGRRLAKTTEVPAETESAAFKGEATR